MREQSTTVAAHGGVTALSRTQTRKANTRLLLEKSRFGFGVNKKALTYLWKHQRRHGRCLAEALRGILLVVHLRVFSAECWHSLMAIVRKLCREHVSHGVSMI